MKASRILNFSLRNIIDIAPNRAACGLIVNHRRPSPADAATASTVSIISSSRRIAAGRMLRSLEFDRLLSTEGFTAKSVERHRSRGVDHAQ